MTGFNEFEYAKQAVKLKVEDYLMKPLDKKTIQETITAVRLQQYLAGEQEKKSVPYLAGKCFEWKKYRTGGI